MTATYILELKQLRRRREDAEAVLSSVLREYTRVQAQCQHTTIDGYRVEPRGDGCCPICLTPL